MCYNVYRYNTMIDGLMKTRQDENILYAISLYHEMKRLNCEPDAFTYAALVFGFAKKNAINDAERYFERYTSSATTTNTTTTIPLQQEEQAHVERTLASPHVVYTIMLHMYVRLRKLKRAEQVLSKYEQLYGHDSAMTQIILYGFVTIFQMHKAEFYFEKLQEQGNAGAQACNVLVRGYLWIINAVQKHVRMWRRVTLPQQVPRQEVALKQRLNYWLQWMREHNVPVDGINTQMLTANQQQEEKEL